MAYAFTLRAAPYSGQAAAKALTCGLLMLAATGHAPPRERIWLLTALAASALGDIVLALPERTYSFVGGLGAFLVAHLAYCGLLWPLAGRTRGWRRLAFPTVWVAAAAMYSVFWPKLGPLAIPVAAYMAALCTMASIALRARLRSPALAIGALSFAASDALIGTERFIGSFAAAPYAIWASYALAQWLIAGAILLDRRT